MRSTYLWGAKLTPLPPSSRWVLDDDDDDDDEVGEGPDSEQPSTGDEQDEDHQPRDGEVDRPAAAEQATAPTDPEPQDEPAGAKAGEAMNVIDLREVPQARVLISRDPATPAHQWAQQRPYATVWEGGLWTDAMPLAVDEEGPPDDLDMFTAPLPDPCSVSGTWAHLYGQRGQSPLGPMGWVMAMDDRGSILGVWAVGLDHMDKLLSDITAGDHTTCPDGQQWELGRTGPVVEPIGA